MAETTATRPGLLPPLLRGQGPVKRLFDVLAALLGLLLLWPVLLWVAWLVRRDSPGPALYRGPRMGRGGKVFRILKFRTMREEAASYAGPRVTGQDDGRITPLGKWLRDTKLNELPQLWNVLKGEMSLVGPRPEDPEIARDWPAEVAAEVLSVRPGITSPASVMYHDEENRLQGIDMMQTYLEEILPGKLRLDQLYVRHRSFWTDLDIIFWTLLVLVPRLGQAPWQGQAPDEVRLLRGPLQVLMHRHVRWFLMDLVTTTAAVAFTALAWRAQAPLDRGWPQMLQATLLFALLFSLTNVLVGTNRISWSAAGANDMGELLPGVVLATVIALIINNVLAATAVYGHFVPDGLLLMAAAFSLLGYIATRYRGRLVTGLATRWLALRGSQPLARERVLVVGGGETGQYAAWKLGHGHYADMFEIVGYVDDDLNKQGSRIRGLNVLGRTADIASVVKKKDVGVVVFAIHNITRAERKRLLALCGLTGAQVLLWPDVAAALYAMNAHEQVARKAAKAATASAPASAITRPRGEPLPCDLCLVRLTPMRIEDWLETLEETAYRGDLAALQEQIRNLREAVYANSVRQREANEPAPPAPPSPHGCSATCPPPTGEG